MKVAGISRRLLKSNLVPFIFTFVAYTINTVPLLNVFDIQQVIIFT
jgi:hypothetical protein